MEAEERNKDVDRNSVETENEYMQETIVDLKQEKVKCKTAFTRARRSLLVMLQQTGVTIDQIDEASDALNTVMEEAMNVMVRLSDRYKALKDCKNCEKLSSEIEKIEVEFTDAQNRAQNVRDELSAEVIHSKFVDGLYKEQQLLAGKSNVNVLPVRGDSREPYMVLNSQSSMYEVID